jgi:two-component system cell cycle response regulator
MARILVIEDNTTNLELMVYLLQAFGYEVLEATDGDEGIEMACCEQPDLVICDVHMPKVDGYEVALRLKNDPALRMVPLVAVTALAMIGDRDKVLAAGFDGYIAKPINPETFLQQVQAFLPPDQIRVEQPQSSRASTKAAPLAPRRGTILVVDNSPVNLSLMQCILEPFSYQVRIAETVDEGLALARQSPFDLIISDVHMPVRDGFAFIQAIRADPQLRCIPFIFLSSTALSATDRSSALALGAAKFIERPIEPQRLLKEVEECLKVVSSRASEGSHGGDSGC